MPKTEDDMPADLIEAWTLSAAATLGSAVRARGILLELRARLPAAVRKSLDINGQVLTLAMPAGSRAEFSAASAVIGSSLKEIESLPVIPREIEDILTITTTERHRWRGDGRLPSAGTRTVKLAGRAKSITFHVFDPRLVEDILDRGVIEEWREEDAAAALENRQRAAFKAKLTRSLKKAKKASPASKDTTDDAASKLRDWDAFKRDGLLR